MARTELFALLHYRVHVRPHLHLASRENAVLARMARDVPASVYRHWQATAHVEFPGIRTTRANYAVACSALLQFFHLVAIENAPMMLPSKAADSVWHTWLAHDAAGLSAFLIKHLKRDVPHVEKAGMGNAQRSMADTWRAAHDYHGNGQFSGPLPSIFEADKLTRMPHGFWYDRNPRDRREGHYHDMDANGAPDLRIKGERVLCWSHVYEVMTPARRARADAELVRHYQTPVHVSARHAKRLEALGVPLGTTASVFLAKEALAMAAHEGKHSGRERRDDQDSMLGCGSEH